MKSLDPLFRILNFFNKFLNFALAYWRGILNYNHKVQAYFFATVPSERARRYLRLSTTLDFSVVIFSQFCVLDLSK